MGKFGSTVYTQLRLGLANVHFALQGGGDATVLLFMKTYQTWDGLVVTPDDAEALGRRLIELAGQAREIGSTDW